MRAELSDLIQHELRDPRRGWITVTRVEMSPDLRHARVLVSVLGDKSEKEMSLHVLQRAGSFLRGAVGRRVRLREVPELSFVLDESIEHSQRILDLLRETEIPPEAESVEGEGPPIEPDDRPGGSASDT
ncbi:MAG: 30S ribosome-binding factor RbfA [Candidatus Eisenbacteria bacterium]|nr:30S ribosome-binding factor RbfA [Candidatus Eisenbacteria bacterium]